MVPCLKFSLPLGVDSPVRILAAAVNMQQREDFGQALEHFNLNLGECRNSDELNAILSNLFLTCETLLLALVDGDVDIVLDIGFFPDDLHGNWTEVNLLPQMLEQLARFDFRLKVSIYISPAELAMAGEREHTLEA